MIEKIIKELDNELVCTDYEIDGDQCTFVIESTRATSLCPYCGAESFKVHSTYQRKVQDLPVQGKQVNLVIRTRKFFCMNEECKNKTFSENFGFAPSFAKRTSRVLDTIIETSANLSSVKASRLLTSNAITISKSTICLALKKNVEICAL